MNKSSLCFASLSYSRLNNNLGECVIQLSDGRFFRVSTYCSISFVSYAVGRPATGARDINLSGTSDKFCLIYELFGLGSIEMVLTCILKHKTLVFVEQNFLIVSVLREGFKHNWDE